MARGRQRRTYDPISSTDASGETAAAAAAAGDDEEADLEEVPIHAANANATRRQLSLGDATSASDESQSLADSLHKDDTDEDDDDGRRITVIILDFAQKKFNVSVNPGWTVKRFKIKGCQIHKVGVSQQRLIYRGKLLADNTTMEDSGIKEDGVIVHLFPKPRVVINDSNNVAAAADSGDDNEDSGGARIPTIVMDADEAERRSSILVLGSPDFLEAQNSVKLFSFMLLMISSIELLNLLAICLGLPQGGPENMETGIPMNTVDDIFDPPDFGSDDVYDPMSNHTSSQDDASDSGSGLQYQQWNWLNSVDLFISVLGVYVALIGIKASNENTMRLAKQYLWGTATVGVLWWLFNYYITVELDESMEQQHEERDDDLFPPMSQKDIYNQALSVMVLPGVLWVLCCFRAFQFHFLLREAEEEAEARMQPYTEEEEEDPERASSNSTGATSPPTTTAANNDEATVQHDEELALQNGSTSSMLV